MGIFYTQTRGSPLQPTTLLGGQPGLDPHALGDFIPLGNIKSSAREHPHWPLLRLIFGQGFARSSPFLVSEGPDDW